jgi:carboxylesterase type B
LNSNPVVDGTFLTAPSLDLSPTAPKLPIPILLGTMHDDGSPFVSYPTSTNLSVELTSQSFNTSAILASPLFSLPPATNTTASIFNLTSRIATDSQFRCLGQSTAYVAAKNNVFDKIYAYEFDRAYQLATYSPNPPACEAPPTPAHPLGDPTLPFYKCHSGELYEVFGTAALNGKPPRDEDDVPFSQFVVDTWSAFARTGDPVPDAGFLEARGFVNTTGYVERSGKWDLVGKGNEKPVRVLDVHVRNEGWREVRECEVLGQGLEYWEHGPM